MKGNDCCLFIIGRWFIEKLVGGGKELDKNVCEFKVPQMQYDGHSILATLSTICRYFCARAMLYSLTNAAIPLSFEDCPMYLSGCRAA